MSVGKGGMPYEKAFVKFLKFYRAQYLLFIQSINSAHIVLWFEVWSTLKAHSNMFNGPFFACQENWFYPAPKVCFCVSKLFVTLDWQVGGCACPGGHTLHFQKQIFRDEEASLGLIFGRRGPFFFICWANEITSGTLMEIVREALLWNNLL